MAEKPVTMNWGTTTAMLAIPCKKKRNGKRRQWSPTTAWFPAHQDDPRLRTQRIRRCCGAPPPLIVRPRHNLIIIFVAAATTDVYTANLCTRGTQHVPPLLVAPRLLLIVTVFARQKYSPFVFVAPPCTGTGICQMNGARIVDILRGGLGKNSFCELCRIELNLCMRRKRQKHEQERRVPTG